ncbi:MAG: hypothetical protein HRT88_03710, partial [Lentisphaeraceae bacterium]|nr:hypothetical protein [Lentisphaeraceae bacterium]
MTITGSNDQPIVSDVTASPAILEVNGTQEITGNVALTTDLDTNDSHTFAVLNATPTLLVKNADGDTITPGVTDLAVEITDEDTGAYKVTGNFDALALGETATVTFSYTATDRSGAANATSAAKTVTLTITGTNDLPVATAKTVTAIEDTDFSFTSDNFTFTDIEDNDLVSVTITALNLNEGTLVHSTSVAVTNGDTLTLTQLNSLVYRAKLNESGNNYASFSFTVNDADSGTEAATMTIHVTPVNDPSALKPDAQTISQDNDATGNVLSNDTDVDDTLTIDSFQIVGDATVYTSVQTATIMNAGTVVGTLEINANGNYTFSPSAGWYGTVPQVTYTTNTGSTSTLDITVNEIIDEIVDQPIVADAIFNPAIVEEITPPEIALTPLFRDPTPQVIRHGNALEFVTHNDTLLSNNQSLSEEFLAVISTMYTGTTVLDTEVADIGGVDIDINEKVYDTPTLSDGEQLFLQTLIEETQPSEEEEGEEEEEGDNPDVSFITDEAVFNELLGQQDVSEGITQQDLDSRVSLQDTLHGEFDIFDI